MKKDEEILLKLSETGDPKALIKLGEFYLKNGITNYDYYKKAFSCFKKAAAKGEAKGLYWLSCCYKKGVGVKEDHDKASAYLIESSKTLDIKVPEVQEEVAAAYANKNDFKQAITWYNKAAEKNSINALNALGYIYLNGCGVKKDEKKAVEYYQKAAKQNDSYALNGLGTIYADEESKLYDKEKALLLFEKSAERGYPYAMLNASDCYIDKDDEGLNAFSRIYYLLAAIDTWRDVEDGVDNESPYPADWQMEAHTLLVDLMEDDDYLSVLMYLAEKNNRVAQFYMYYFLSNSLDRKLTKYQKEALKMLIQSADNGFPNAQYELGVCVFNGLLGCRKNTRKAICYLEKAAAQGHQGAEYFLQSIGKELDEKN